jgi:4-hydroxy-3-polyprenylbenzoate decarboxylase
VTGQGLPDFLRDYEGAHPGDVCTVDREVSLDQDITAVVWELADRGEHPLLRFPCVKGADREVVTNLFASRARIERMLGARPGELHDRYQDLAAGAMGMAELDDGPVTGRVDADDRVDLFDLPLLTHFASDLGPYITSGIVVAEDADGDRGNLSYHRSVVASKTSLGTSLHSRGDLWRLLQDAAASGRRLPVAMVVGAHPLFMLAASARAPFDVDEREIAGGLLGAPLEVVRTPKHGLRVPASAEVVLEGEIDPAADEDEGPFGEFSGYSSDRSTRNRIDVCTVMQRDGAVWVDVVGGNSHEHLNLGRVPREAEMIAKLKDRFPSVVGVHYPNSGTHFHCYVAVDERRAGEARQALLGLLGWDPYLKTVVAVDSDVDITDDQDVLWALATHFQPAQDMMVIDGLPGSALDPSAGRLGTTSRLALDATRGANFDAQRIRISPEARSVGREIASDRAAGMDG